MLLNILRGDDQVKSSPHFFLLDVRQVITKIQSAIPKCQNDTLVTLWGNELKSTKIGSIGTKCIKIGQFLTFYINFVSF